MKRRLEPISGVIAPILTPFHDDLTIAQSLFAGHSRHLLETGCAGLAPFGTTGEALSLGIEERMAALEGLIESGIDPKKLIPGTGLTNLPDTTKLTRHALDRGCAGVMVLPPFYFKNVHDEGLFAYFSRLIESVASNDLRIYLYHIPPVSQVGLSIELIQRLRSRFPAQIVGIKDSSGDWENTRRLLTEVPGLIVYPGSELPLLEALALGAPGCITATANINAAQIAKIVSLHQRGQQAEAKHQHEAVKKVRLKIQEYGPIPAQKYLLSAWSGDGRWRNVRPPFLRLADTVGRELRDTLEREFGFAPSPRTLA
ncbi:MAG TPA: dihydrodipicolinate synthase family protein [bacterium]|nr:dihydrodipicolinate synthase family protein [bacterium]